MTGYFIVCGVWILAAVLPLKLDARAEPRTSVKSELTTVVYPNGTRIQVELADTDEKRARGLMFRDQLARDGGMLFIFSEPGQWSFWMKNTLVPLDMVFIGPDGKIGRIAANTVPMSLDPVASIDAVQAVLEIAGGRAAELGIKEGDKVSWPH